MFRKRFRQQVPELNTTSTADISFMLLIFFLVTSSMDTDKGMLRQLAPPPIEQQQQQDISKDLVLQVSLDGQDRLMLDGEPVTLQQLTASVIAMASVNRVEHVVSVQADRASSYEAYFRMQDAIVEAYHSLRNQYARQRYGKSYQTCTAEERALVNGYYPQRISEQPLQKGGNR